MIRAGVVLSILAALAWLGLTFAVTRSESEDALILALFFLPIAFMAVLALIWAIVGLVRAIERWRTNFAKPA